LYLLIGQSNMAGRAAIEEQDRAPLNRVYLLTDQDQWEPAVNPLNRYSTIRKALAMQKLGPGYTFARKLAAMNPDIEIGLVVNVKGGSSINEWVKGEHFYEEAIKKVRIAEPAGAFKGIIWHQGESDRTEADSYLAKLEALVANLRADMGIPDLPFVAGEIGRFVEGAEPINRVIRALPDRVGNTAVVTAEGLTDHGDVVHFDSRSQRLLGERYADRMLALAHGTT